MRIRCTLPNASANINGVAFEADGETMVSVDVASDVADSFLSIPGYEDADAAPVKPKGKPGPKPKVKEPDAVTAADDAVIAAAADAGIQTA